MTPSELLERIHEKVLDSYNIPLQERINLINNLENEIHLYINDNINILNSNLRSAKLVLDIHNKTESLNDYNYDEILMYIKDKTDTYFGINDYYGKKSKRHVKRNKGKKPSKKRHTKKRSHM